VFEAVLNPFAWWGLAAVSVPIIIHLINRLRYKKVHWAAMEFLLKAMQKHKRKLLMEQLLLLLMRIAVILLIVLLIVRPTWFLGGEGNEAGSVHHHVFLLDDSLSSHDLDDAQRPDGANVFRRGTQLLVDLSQAHALTSANHHWTVLLWSNPANPEVGLPVSTEKAQGTRMTTEEATRLRERLEELKPSYLAITPLPVLQQAVKHLDLVKEGRKHLHIVGDFRKTTWQAAGEEAYALLADLSKQGKVRLQFHDLARPERGPTPGEAPPAHGNLVITQLVAKPRRNPDATSISDLPLRVVTPRLPFDVHVTVRNFGAAEHSKLRLTLRSDGVGRGERLIDRLAGGEERTFVFNLEYAADEPAGIKSLSAKLEDPDGRDHLAVDDVRFGFVELRAKVPVLIVDPDARNSDAVTDWLFVAAALTGSDRTGVKPDVITPRDLTNRKNLSQYAVVYLLNVAGVGRSEGDLDEDGMRNLERYARNGGSLVFFLGPRTNVASFNDRLYAKGQGVFPAPLLFRPDPEGRKSLSYIDDEPDRDDTSTQLRFLKPHPAFPFTGDIADTFSRYIHVNRYFRVDPQWKPGEASGDVLVQLANRRPLANYAVDARRLANELNDVAGAVPDGKLKQYVGRMTSAIEDADKKKARKGELIDALIGALGEPAATEFWKDKQNAELRKRLTDFLAVLQQGDPLVIEATVQGGARPGRVMVILTTASPTAITGKSYNWQDMAAGDLGQFFFVPMMLGVQEHLASQSRAAELTTSALVQAQPLEMRLDKDRFNPQVEVWFQKEGEVQPTKIDTVNGERVKPLFQPLTTAGAKPEDQYDWLVRVRPVQGPGHYRLRFNQVGGNVTTDLAAVGDPGKNLDTAKIPEERPLAFNVDGRTEGDLTRISEDQLRDGLADGLMKGATKTPPGEAREYVAGKSWFVLNALESQANEALQNQTWSDYSWVLLAFVALLLTEQFLAMKFSHHVA
jgi:hypothetical protein